MAVQVIFFEKPGCTNNTRQKQWLRDCGIAVVAINLLEHEWSEAELLQFFGDLPVADWFNRSAPRVKSGEVVPEQLSRDEALTLLLAEPLLIRRPLLRSGDERKVGFDPALIADWLQIPIGESGSTIKETCPRPAQPCMAEEEGV